MEGTLRKKIICFAIALALLGLFLLTELVWKSGYETIALEEKDAAGAYSFVAAFGEVTAVAVCNNDVSLGMLPDEQDVTILVDIKSADGTLVATLRSDSLRIHTNGYSNTEAQTFAELPVTLTAGEPYTLHYEASVDGRPLKDLSFLLYGGRVRFTFLSCYLFVIGGLLAGLLVFAPLSNEDGKPRKVALLGCWVLLVLLHLPSIPLTFSATADSFAHAYAVSNRMLSQPVSDEEDRVYVEESGIRNSGYLSYSVPLNRFLRDGDYGNVTEEGRSSINYTTKRPGVQPLVYPEGAVVAAARLFHSRYQTVFLAPRFAKWAVLFVLLLVTLMFAERSSKKGIGLILPVFYLPSVICGSFAYYPGEEAAFHPDHFLCGLFVNRTLHGEAFVPLFLVVIGLLMTLLPAFSDSAKEEDKGFRLLVTASAICALAAIRVI